MPHATHYDAIVIGTSWGGRFLPNALAQAGQKVAVIERGHLGGTCVNVGCTPTKTMVASARVAYLARRGADYGVHTGPLAIDLPAVRRRKQDIVDVETQHILGCATLGLEGGEIMAILQVATMGQLPYTVLREGTFTHPALAEGLNSLFMTLDS